MPRSQGTSRKGKPKKGERSAGMGRALERSQQKRYKPKSNGSSQTGGGMASSGAQSIGIDNEHEETTKMRSVLEVDDLADFLGQAEMAGREFVSEKERFVVLDSIGSEYRPETTSQSRHHSNGPKDDFVFHELSVPRRPAWDENTTPQQLHELENKSFIAWRRSIAEKEELLMLHQSSSTSNKKSVTPFEKNLEVWRQLWRVLERSSCIIQIVDARNPLFYISQDLRTYVVDELKKPMLIVVNKSDYLSPKQRKVWHEYLKEQKMEHLFFSAYEEQKKLDDMATALRRERDVEERYEDKPDDEDGDDETEEKEKENSKSGKAKENNETLTFDNMGVERLLTREQLLSALQLFASNHGCQGDERYDNRVQYGMVGFPNVGKSSVINVLVGSSKHAHGVVRVGVAAQPGKTKHFQTLLLPDVDEMMLCDCPGLVFPSFVSSTADLIAAGVYPIAQMRDYWHVVTLICQRIPREVLNVRYGIQLPAPSVQDLKERGLTKADVDCGKVALPPPTAEEFLGTYCVARGMLAPASGVPDYQRASRVIIKEYVEGKLLFCHPPPNLATANDSKSVEASEIMMEASDFYRETLQTTFRNTKKLREKIEGLPPMEDGQNADRGQEEESADDDSYSGGEQEEDDIPLEDDLDILDIVGGMTDAADDNKPKKNGGKRGKAHKSIKKWGKKGRKDRNKDPYGCYSEPDAMLTNGSSMGVHVNAGKYGSGSFTRANYTGARAAVPFESGKKHRRKRGGQ